MAFLTSSVSSTHTYRAGSEINFFLNDHGALTVTIDTDNLHIRSVEPKEDDYNSFAALFGDPEVMCQFATGETKTKKDMETRIKNVWVKRWEQNDPYSGLAVFKNDTDEFIGHTVIGHTGTPGESSLAYLFMKKHWGKGFGKEAVISTVQEYAPATIKEGYILDGKTLEKITATTRPDNLASKKILEKVGMHQVGEEEKYGALRYHFSIDLSQINTNFK